MNNGVESGKEKRMRNLIPIKPGEKRNPKGGSKKQREMLEFRSWIKENCPNHPKSIFKVLCDGAKKGRDFRYVQEYLDRYQGKVPQKIGTEDGKPMEFIIKVMSKETAEASAKLRAQFTRGN